MKTYLTLFIILLQFELVANGQSKDEKEVAAAIEIFIKGIIDADKSIFDTIVSDDLVYSHSSGKVQDKAAFIEGIISRQPLDYLKVDLSDQTIKIIGETAIVRHNFSSETSSNGIPGILNLGIMHIWVKENGKWKLLARQAYKI
jgi:hypothetical protein